MVFTIELGAFERTEYSVTVEELTAVFDPTVVLPSQELQFADPEVMGHGRSSWCE